METEKYEYNSYRKPNIKHLYKLLKKKIFDDLPCFDIKEEEEDSIEVDIFIKTGESKIKVAELSIDVVEYPLPFNRRFYVTFLSITKL